MLLDKADSDMYENKQLCKKRNLGSRQQTENRIKISIVKSVHPGDRI